MIKQIMIYRPAITTRPTYGWVHMGDDWLFDYWFGSDMLRDSVWPSEVLQIEVGCVSFKPDGCMYCVEWTQYSIRLEAVGYPCTSSLLPAFDDA